MLRCGASVITNRKVQSFVLFTLELSSSVTGLVQLPTFLAEVYLVYSEFTVNVEW